MRLKTLFSGGSKERDPHKANEKAPLDDYDVGQVLGEGGFGTVRKAHLKGASQGVDVAVKIIPRKVVAVDRNQTKEVKRRFGIMQSLAEHPHIIRLIDYRMTKTTLFAFYEFCRGKDLFDRILEQPNGRFTEEQSRSATRALTDAIAYIHDRNMAHRDIKPENVLYRTADGPYDDLVLADFGLAVELKPDDVLQGAAGSPGYWSPEMCSGKGYGMIADEWALGIVVYAMLSGRSPFKSLEADDLRREAAKGIITYPKKYWDAVSEDARDFCQKLLQKDPAHRMTARGALEHKWLLGGSAEKRAEKKVESDKTTAVHTAEGQDGRLERRATMGLSPAGLSVRFDKPRHDDAEDDTSTQTGQSPAESTHVLDVRRVLSGDISHDKLALLASLDEEGSAAPSPDAPSSRRPSHADPAEQLKDLNVSDGRR